MYDAFEMPLDVVSPRTTSFGLVRTCGALLLLASVAGCASHRGTGGGSASAQRGMYKVGAPYVIDGVTYTPMEEFTHVETGVASWYGPGFHGKYTANGEVYDQSDRTAAHRTLPMRKASCSRRLPEVPWLASEFFPVWGILNELEA